MNQALNVILGGALPVQADSTEAYCQLSRHDHTLPLEGGLCSFSQRQCNVNITFNRTTYHFPANEQGTGYQRSANAEGLRFTAKGTTPWMCSGGDSIPAVMRCKRLFPPCL